MSEAGEADPLHPRHSHELVGHGAAERMLLDSLASGRLPHAWLIGGPRGIGKATLAYRFARFLLRGEAAGQGGGLFGDAAPPGLAMDPDEPVFRRIAAAGHADLLTVERGVNEKSGKLRGDIVIDDVRRIAGFFSLTAAEGGWRVCIVDSADEMNRNAANALLKIVEEPPPGAVILILAHAPGSLLPTIRSRCRRLTLRPLDDRQVAEVLATRAPDLAEAERLVLARLAEGSPGRAMGLARLGGLEVYRELLGLLGALPSVDVPALHAFGDRMARRDSDGAWSVLSELLGWWLARMIRAAAAGQTPAEAAPGEAALMRRLAEAGSLEHWIEVWEKVCHLFERADSLNLDRKQVVLNAFTALGRAAQP